MPADSSVNDFAQPTVDMYRQAQDQLADQVATRLQQGDPDTDGWTLGRLALTAGLALAAHRIITTLARATPAAVGAAILGAYLRGSAAAVAELGRTTATRPAARALRPALTAATTAAETGMPLAEVARKFAAELPGIVEADRAAKSLTSVLAATHPRAEHWATDAYRQVIQAAADTMRAGATTRREAAAAAWRTLMDRGVTGFVDRAGRGWELATYVEMAVRTNVAHAAIQGHVDRLTQAGISLVYVANAPTACPKCRPWAGRILTLDSTWGARDVAATNALTGRPTTVRAAGSLAEAQAAGLHHPNCVHPVSAYLPGVTKIGRPQGNPTRRYEATQRQRQIERHIRQWKRRAATDLDPTGRRNAAVKVRQWQATQRVHTTQHDLRRKPERERAYGPR